MLNSGTEPEWRKFCGTNNPEGDGCVEFAVEGDTVLLRDSKKPDAGTLTFSMQEVSDFVQGWPTR